MKAYGQFCAIAKALDVVGERWTLLIVRELLLRPSRFTDLLDGLPGIARNLLADRLRGLQEHGLVAHEGDLYALTPRGEELRPVLRALAGFGRPALLEGPADDAIRGRWVHTAVDARYGDDPDVEVVTDDDHEVTLRVHGQELRGPPATILARLADV